MTTEQVLKNNFEEFWSLAEYAYSNGKYNGAVTLYYKALVELCDIALLRNSGRIGSNHNERFSLLKSEEPKIYDIASKLFRYYRDSYSNQITKTIATEVKSRVEDVEEQVFPKNQEVD
jgi:uncharacterized protein (UPF0332 family)